MACRPEVGVWYTLDCDCLVTEGETLERLRERAAAVLPELIANNATHIDPERRAAAHSLRPAAFTKAPFR